MCRTCLKKWHGLPLGRELTADEQMAIVSLLLEWLEDQIPARQTPLPHVPYQQEFPF